MPAPLELTITFRKERETKSTWVYREETEMLLPKNVGTLYIKKHAIAALGAPEVITVNIRERTTTTAAP